jgi:hypothetical protein
MVVVMRLDERVVQRLLVGEELKLEGMGAGVGKWPDR